MVNIMIKSVKAVLYSAILFPGAGHFLLKKYLRGTIFLLVSIFSIFLLVSATTERAYKILEKIELGEVQPDINSILVLLMKEPSPSEAQLIHTGFWLLIIIWGIGIIDSYILSKQQKKDQNLSL